MSNVDRVLSARWVIPITRAPIHAGWVRIRDGRIVEIGTGRNPEGEDLGDVALLPRLVNAHTHLEFSDCPCPIGDPGMPLATWIGQVVSARAKSGDAGRDHAISVGLSELAATGTCLAGEISTPPCKYPDKTCTSSKGESAREVVSLVSFAEVLGLSDERAIERLHAAKQHNEDNQETGISPHAPYSTSLSTIRSCAEFARDQDLPLAMHFAESPDERQLLSDGTGPFVDALKSIGAWRDRSFPWTGDAYETLIDQASIAPRTLLVHGNDLSDSEINRIARNANLTVVYCPRTHAFFGYDKHPVDRLLSAGVRVALGTDSRASNPDLNLWSEVQYILRHRQDVRPKEVLAMATISGAEALGRSDLGHFEPGAKALLGFARTHAADVEQLYADLSEADFHPLFDSNR